MRGYFINVLVYLISIILFPFFCGKGTRFSDGDGSSNEVQRTMLELINQLDGFDPRGNIKVLMATNRYASLLVAFVVILISLSGLVGVDRPDTLDPALLRPGRMDRKVEFGLPDQEVRSKGGWEGQGILTKRWEGQGWEGQGILTVCNP